jgi:hypothetical protein
MPRCVEVIEGTVLAIDNDHMFDWRGRGLIIGASGKRQRRRNEIG